jgi:alkylglycerol monooxygenase
VPLLALALKPLPVAAALAWVLRSRPLPSRSYRALLAAGLCCGICGDVLLSLPGRFLAGLAAFLAGHACYLAAFALAGARLRPLSLAGPLSLALLVFALLQPYLGALAWPVLAYVVAIALMAALALDRYRRVRTPGALRAALGAGLFLVSDAALAWAKFRGPLGSRTSSALLVMGTYYAAQRLLASSAGEPGPAATGQESAPAGR